ncbi:hypothetical protein [Xenorhabdus nematophila]|uniref:hypothetical protein n=1 Tax=Xenorhabdus nematophila TaxID=628 RepID=UPI0030D7A144
MSVFLRQAISVSVVIVMSPVTFPPLRGNALSALVLVSVKPTFSDRLRLKPVKRVRNYTVKNQ